MKAILASMLLVGTVPHAMSAEACDVPVSDWQPRDVLQVLLEAHGFKVRSITAQNGCYEAITVDQAGRAAATTFNPKTLVQVGTQHAVNKG